MATNATGTLLAVAAAVVGFLALSGRAAGGGGIGGGGGPRNGETFIDESTVSEAVRGITDVQVGPASGIDYSAPGTGVDVGIDLNPTQDPLRHDGPTMTLGTGAFPFGRTA